jgi:hypothetical protein
MEGGQGLYRTLGWSRDFSRVCGEPFKRPATSCSKQGLVFNSQELGVSPAHFQILGTGEGCFKTLKEYVKIFWEGLPKTS